MRVGVSDVGGAVRPAFVIAVGGAFCYNPSYSSEVSV